MAVASVKDRLISGRPPPVVGVQLPSDGSSVVEVFVERRAGHDVHCESVVAPVRVAGERSSTVRQADGDIDVDPCRVSGACCVASRVTLDTESTPMAFRWRFDFSRSGNDRANMGVLDEDHHRDPAGGRCAGPADCPALHAPRRRDSRDS